MSTTAERKPAEPYTTEEQEVINGLVACQEHLSLNDEEFCRNYLKTYTRTTWSKLKSGTYEAKDRSKTMAELRAALKSTRRRIARQEKVRQGKEYHEFDVFTALFKAVSECLIKKGENRLIFYVAPTGCGKSQFIAELERRETVTSVRANETWRASFLFAVLDILKEMEVTGTFTGPQGKANARQAMLEAMRARAEVLAIDEGNYFGPSSINLVKDILNETEWTVVIALTPGSFQAMKSGRSWNEWSQLQRRIHSVFEWEDLSAAEAENFLEPLGMNGDLKAASIKLQAAANDFGGMDFATRVVDRVASVVKGTPGLDDVTAAITLVKKQLGRPVK